MAYGGVVQHRPARGGRTAAVVARSARPVSVAGVNIPRNAPGRGLVARRPAPGNQFSTFTPTRRAVFAPQSVIVPPQYALGDAGDDDFAQFGGFSLKGIAKAVKKVASPIQKGVAAVGHTAGAVVTSKIGQGILGTALAVTGVGALPAAGIFAATKGAGNLIKKGGNLKHAVTGAAQGAVEGVISVGAGKAVRAIGSKVLNRGAKAATKNTSALESAALDAGTALATGGPLGPRITGNGDMAPSGPTPEEIGQQNQQRAEIEMAQSAAEAARAEAARQVAEAQANANAARQQGQDEAAAQYQAQMAELEKQRAAAEDAARAAQTASQSAQGSTDSGQLQSLLDAARQAAQAAQAAAAAPPTPQATQAVQTAATAATDAANDATADTAGAPVEASMLGNINPLVLIGGLAIAAIVFKPKKRRAGAR